MKQKKLLITILPVIIFLTSNYEVTATAKKTTVANKSTQNSSTRFGSNKVGYITRTNKWLDFNDPNTSANAKQITLDGVNIITLDIVAENTHIEADQAAEITYQRYLNAGFPTKNLSKKDISLNGYKGKQVNIKFPDGTVLIVNYIKHNNNIYFISQEGIPEYQNTLSSVVNTWKPVK